MIAIKEPMKYMEIVLFFIHEYFKNKCMHGEFLEYEEVYDGNFYCTLKIDK